MRKGHLPRFEDRRDALIDHYAERVESGKVERVDLIEVAACLYRMAHPLPDRPPGAHEVPLDRLIDELDRQLAEPGGDMFWMYPMVLVQNLGRGILPDALLGRMREQWRTYTPYRGDTENHWLMYHASLYLVTQLFPSEPPETWFNGRSSEENFEDARSYLLHWIDLTTSRGQAEFDSPHYLSFFLAPLALLYAFAADPDMRLRAEMMLDYIIADFAVDTLNGLYSGAFSRVYPEPVLDRWKNGSTTFAWLLFGNVPFRPDPINVILQMQGYRPHGAAAVLAMSGYSPPEILHHVATDRSRPYVHRELKRTRTRIRYSDIPEQPVYKTTYMTADYALGSIQGGLLQPIQQHTWELQWATDDPHEGRNVLFSIHPYSSPHELAMYFPEEPEMLTRAVLEAKKETYDSPFKWTGGSPFEFVVQQEDALIALYEIPDGTRFPHVNTFISRTLSHFVDDESGWIFARGGGALIALYPLAPFVWQEDDGGDRRLHSPHLKNGVVLQVASASAFLAFDVFCAAVRELPLETITDPHPRVRFTTLRGRRIEAAYGESPRIDGEPIDYEQWPLFGDAFLDAQKDSRRLEIRHGERRRVLDFSVPQIRNA